MSGSGMRIFGLTLAWIVALGMSGPRPVRAGDETRQAGPSGGPLKELKVSFFGSSSTGMLIRGMDGVLGALEDIRIAHPKSQNAIRVDQLSQDIEAGGERRYLEFLDKARKSLAKRKSDFVVLQVSGGIFYNEAGEKHVGRILDDMCVAIKGAGATPVLFEHWSENPDKMRKYCLDAARKHGGRVAFCGSAAAEVIAEKKGQGDARQPYLGGASGGTGHTNSRGIYLWTCCMLTALTDRSPIGLPLPAQPVSVTAEDIAIVPERGDAPGGGHAEPTGTAIPLVQEDIEYLQKKAWEAQQKYGKLIVKEEEKKP